MPPVSSGGHSNGAGGEAGEKASLPTLPSPTPAHDIVTTVANHSGFHDPATYLARPLRCLLPIAQRLGAHIVAATASTFCLHGLSCVALGSGVLLIYHRLQSLENRIEELIETN